MNVRKSVVAGRFYPGTAKDLQGMIAMCLSGASTFFGPDAQPKKDALDTPCMLMLPHAGYIFSAPVACAALLGTRLPKTVILLCPNHTGYGRSRFGVWSDGAWETPLGLVPVNADLAQKLAAKKPFAADTLCHMKEHSIEVELPLLQAMATKQGTDFDIVPVCIASQTNADLKAAGLALAEVAGDAIVKGEVGIVVSSDMNHYENEKTTMAKDNLALEKVLAEDARGLLETCAQNCITMCGAGPMALALHALRAIRLVPTRKAWLVAHETSGRVAGDFEKVVGYAGVRFYL